MRTLKLVLISDTVIKNDEVNTQPDNANNETVIENDGEIIETKNENMGNTKEKRTKSGRAIKKPNRYC